MATNSVSSSPVKSRTFYIYALSAHEGVFYVGQTTDPQARFWSHQSNARSTPKQKVYQTIRLLGYDPDMDIIDQITTPHEMLALKLEECWIQEMKNRGCELSNQWKTGICVDHTNPMRIAAIVKQFANATDEELQRFSEIEQEIAFSMVFSG